MFSPYSVRRRSYYTVHYILIQGISDSPGICISSYQYITLDVPITLDVHWCVVWSSASLKIFYFSGADVEVLISTPVEDVV